MPTISQEFVMNAIRQIYDDAPESIVIPEPFRHHRMEVILIALDERRTEVVDANGWPVGFFERTAGQWAGEPLERAPQGDYEVREELE
jgi:hypothetical protein